MGVDCRIQLPGDVCVDDVAQVLGVAAGLPWTAKPGAPQRVAGAKVVATTVPQMAEIRLVGPMVDGERARSVFYHFEHGTERLLLPRSTPFWIAVGWRLVEFFGGSLDYDDSDANEDDYTMPRRRNNNSPEADEEWERFKNEIKAVLPISLAELREAAAFAAYK